MIKTDERFVFVLCKDKKFKWEWWALKVETIPDLMNFMNIRAKNMTETYINLKKKLANKNHINWEEACMTQLLSNVENRKTFVDDIFALNDKLLGSYRKCFFKGKILLINQVFGFRFLDETVEILETKIQPNYVFPDELNTEIRIIKWTNGIHYYAKVGKRDVVINDEQKWHSYKEAKRMAEKFKKLYFKEK